MRCVHAGTSSYLCAILQAWLAASGTVSLALPTWAALGPWLPQRAQALLALAPPLGPCPLDGRGGQAVRPERDLLEARLPTDPLPMPGWAGMSFCKVSMAAWCLP